ncbi:glycerophosphodiester phosphodiesterase [Parvibaculaceae bacterium PLY_AMNH_Bact1]|nr:glycerophosphodiester phosphodiesterase [Parvibaculaceae bacterium PLY_AMNH_Bact1]
MSRPAKFPYLETDGVLAFAHRGGTSAHPENTLPAFQHAIDLGYRYLETDVHATRDGVLLAFHDEELDRVTDMAGRIAEMDYAQVAQARVDGREPIPLLADLLSSWPEARFNIDPKQDNAAEPLAKVLNDANALDRVCVTSFSDKRTVGIRGLLGPRLCTGLGPAGTARMRFSSLSGPFSGLWGNFVQGCLQIPTHQFGIRLVDRRLIEHAHAHGLQVHVWTIDEPQEMRRLLDLGVDGLMTDRPEVLKSVLDERGVWR